MKSRPLSALMLASLAPSYALAQGDAKKQEMTFQIAAAPNSPVWRVTKAEPSGEMTLKFEGHGDGSMLVLEGYFLMLPANADGKALARVLITDVDAEGVTLKTSPAAAKAFGEGAAIRLIRPFPATTKQLKAIPELVALADPNAGAGNALKAARDAANRARSVNNLKQIGLAFHNYHATFDHLPPAVVRDADGKPRHSWRVLILPFIERVDLFNEYDFSQPWDSEKNLKLLDKMPAVYRDPAHGDDKGHFAHYAVMTGEATLFPPEGAKLKGDGKMGVTLEPEGLVSFAQVTDGLSNTIAVAPMSPARKVPWTKPEDIPFDEDFPVLGSTKGIATPYEVDGVKVAPVLLMDGSVKTLSSRTNPAVVNTLLTKGGGEVVAADVFGVIRGVQGQPGMATLTITVEGGKATATIR